MLVRLADFVGSDDFLTTVARWLGVDRDAIANHNSIRLVQGLIQGEVSCV